MDTAALENEVGRGALPELDRAALSPEQLREKMGPARAAVVRGMLGPREAQRLSDGVDRAFAAFDDPPSDPDWYAPFESKSGYLSRTRGWMRQHGGILAVDCPPMLALIREIYRETALVHFVRDYLGETPVLSSYKTALRLTAPGAPNVGWHQDGAFLGDNARVLNVWLALTHCGVDAPSLDVVLARHEEVIGTGDSGAAYEWSLSDERAQAQGRIATPVMAPGDAIVFDHLCLHRTAAMKATRARKAIEAWFFAAPTLPEHYDSVPI